MKKSNGCLVAFWIIAGIFGLVVLLHLAVAYYFYSKKFELRHIEFQDETSTSSTTASSRGPQHVFFGTDTPVTTEHYRFLFVDLTFDSHGTQATGPMTVIIEPAPAAGTQVSTSRPVKATSFKIEGDDVSFTGHDDGAGDIAFHGKLDRRAHTLTGDLSFDGRTFQNVTLKGYIEAD